MRFALIAALLATPTFAAPALTTIQDTLYKADGARFDGIAQIEWKSFQSADGSEVPQQSLSVKIVAGLLRVSLVPTTNALRSVTYVVKYNSNGKTQFTEYWAVPPSATAVRLKDVRSGQQAGAITSPNPVINDIEGLRSELDVRPVKGSGFAVSRAAVINSSGRLDAALGQESDCVHVDGTSGPCGSGGGSGALFVDAETPAGLVNGSNGNFTLASTPSPASSLLVYRNGILLRQGSSYTVSGSAITMAVGSIPAPGDVLQVWYRIAGTGPSVQFYGNETPGGTVNGINTAFTLQAAPQPASSLQLYRNGILLKQGLDFSISGSAITFVAGAIPYTGDVLQASYRR